MQPVKTQFPTGFLWGASTSAHQVEGYCYNQWAQWEVESADRLAAEAGPDKDYGNGRPAPVWPHIAEAAKDPKNYISDIACDHYNRFEEDLDLAQQLGLTAYRFSIEWSRVEPVEGSVNQEALDHYRKVIRACRARGIEPVACLWHWTHPMWFEQKGAWENGCSVWWFKQYVQATVNALADEGVTYWLVLNEPEVYNLLSYGPKWAAGNPWPPQRGSYRRFREVSKRLIDCHKQGYAVIKEMHGDRSTMVSSAVNLSFNEAKGLLGRAVKAFVENGMWQFHEETRDYQDFVGLNYYMHQVYKGRNPFGGNKFNWQSDLGWELYPEGLYHVLMQLKHRMTGKPVIITEHGLADRNDYNREQYLYESLRQCHRAIGDGVDLRGYLHWSLLDNFEWDKGFWPEFGLIHVDRATLERTIRPSARFYSQVIRANALPSPR